MIQVNQNNSNLDDHQLQTSSDPNDHIDSLYKLQSKRSLNKPFGFFKKAAKTLIWKMINSNQNSAEPLSPSYLASQSQQETPTQPDQHETYIVEQRTRPYWESGETSFGHRNQDQLTDYYGSYFYFRN